MPNKLSRFWQEVKRRNVHRSLAVYAGTSFMIFEASSIIFPRWGLPDWTIDLVLYLLIAGLLITFIVSWIYDVTPEGVQKTAKLEEAANENRRTVSLSWKISTYVSLVVIAGLVIYNVVHGQRLRASLYNMEKSIAVLPFDNLSADSAQLWFAAGISDVISSQLTKISGYRVIGRKSTEQYRDKAKNIAEIGKALDVNFVVDGAVQKDGDRIRIVTQLIRVRNETNLWSDVYDDTWDEIFEIQEDIAKKVAGSLRTALSPEEDAKIANAGTRDPEAWVYYVQGNGLIQMQTETNIWKAIDKYQQAIDLDDHFAEAYSGLAMAYSLVTIWQVPRPEPTYIREVKQNASRALELNEQLAEPYFVFGMISFYHEWDWKAAERSFKKGMERISSYSFGLMYYSNFLTLMRRYDESISVAEFALQLEPLDAFAHAELAFAHMHLGHQDKARELTERCLVLNPDLWNAKAGLAYFYALEGTNLQYVYDFCEEQLGLFHGDLQHIPSMLLGTTGQLLAMAGSEDQVREILHELNRRIETGSEDTPYLSLGLIYNVLGESTKALDNLEKGVEIQEPFIYVINYQPGFQSLRTNERFQLLLEKLGFEV